MFAVDIIREDVKIVESNHLQNPILYIFYWKSICVKNLYIVLLKDISAWILWFWVYNNVLSLLKLVAWIVTKHDREQVTL